MPVTLTSTPVGGASCNSFVSAAEAEAYFAARLAGERWADVEEEDRRAMALIEAASELNQLNWLGSRVSDTQALAWPRANVPKKDAAGVDGGGYRYGFRRCVQTYESDEIPPEVKDAQCELALALLEGWGEEGDAGIRSLSVGAFSVTAGGGPEGRLPRKVSRLLSGLRTGAVRARG